MAGDGLAERCRLEIEQLHEFFVAWMTGALPREAGAFARFADVLAADFNIVSPGGVVTDRAALLVELEAAHGARGKAAGGIEIRIEGFRVLRRWDGGALVSYQEWQRAAGAETARISTALFTAHADAPNGVQWLHVHETWLAEHAPVMAV